jgi:hypothetical protein
LFASLLTGKDPDVNSSIDSALARAGRVSAGRLLEGLEQDDDGRVQAGAAGLAGLGIGFTPAGDDFLMGTLFALWATRGEDVAGRLGDAILRPAIDRTSRVSLAWLASAARGEASEPWHDLCDAMTRGWSEATTAAVRQILVTGHSSGEDAMVAFVRGLEILAAGPTVSRK